MSDERVHASDCATNNAPALPIGPCDCGVERLQAAAIIRDGEVIEHGFKSHWELRQAINPRDPDPRIGRPGDIEGFVTSAGRFVDRDEAREVAINSGQIHHSWKTAQRKLLSSDINW